MNGYDRILKENIEPLVPFFASLVGIDWDKAEIKKDKVQETIEREADFVLLLDRGDEPPCILHLDFQLKEDPQMPGRMLLYYALFHRKYGLPVIQVVVYLRKPTRKSVDPGKLLDKKLTYGYYQLYIRSLPATLFLSSDVPEQILLAILADFEGRSPKELIQELLERLKSVIGETFSLGKYVNQLRVLSRIRNLKSLTDQIIAQMPFDFISVESDLFFRKGLQEGRKSGLQEGRKSGLKEGMVKGLEKGIQKGIEKGLEKGIEKGRSEALAEAVAKLLALDTFTAQQVAQILGLPLSEVQRIQGAMQGE